MLINEEFYALRNFKNILLPAGGLALRGQTIDRMVRAELASRTDALHLDKRAQLCKAAIIK